jgi:hypothetical protein
MGGREGQVLIFLQSLINHPLETSVVCSFGLMFVLAFRLAVK